MIYYKTEEEIELIRECTVLIARTLTEVASRIQPGIPTIKLDAIAEEFIRSNDAEPAFKGYMGFPNSLCISVNEAVVHGIPGSNEIQEGDIISVDCGVHKNGYYGDSAFSFLVKTASQDQKDLLSTTRQSLLKGVEQARIGNRIGDVSSAIQSYIESIGKYSIVRELVGHGIGKHIHEDPEVPNFGKRGTGRKIKEGLVIAVEPMVNLGKKNIVQSKDKWTIRTADNHASAHYETMVAVTKQGPDMLTRFEGIEEQVKQNDYLEEIV